MTPVWLRFKSLCKLPVGTKVDGWSVMTAVESPAGIVTRAGWLVSAAGWLVTRAVAGVVAAEVSLAVGKSLTGGSAAPADGLRFGRLLTPAGIVARGAVHEV